jgi:hypothetical protein
VSRYTRLKVAKAKAKAKNREAKKLSKSVFKKQDRRAIVTAVNSEAPETFLLWQNKKRAEDQLELSVRN